jgi:acetyl-CoA carboxylase biotin carboxyl carrier protein
VNLSSEDVQDILRLLDTLPFAEAELETSRFVLRLRRAGDGVWAQELQVRPATDGAEAAPGAGPGGQQAGTAVPPAIPPGAGHATPPPLPGVAGPALPPASPAGGASGAPPAGPGAAVPPAGPHAAGAAGTPHAAGAPGGQAPVRAPLMGTFYRAPQPGAAPFVETGAQVAPETVVAIIETMKLMNPVYAGTSGTVAVITANDGQFVERDAVLMLVRAPDAKSTEAG